eukprot:1142442-Pelagomonas_calceolata.AAC.1
MPTAHCILGLHPVGHAAPQCGLAAHTAVAWTAHTPPAHGHGHRLLLHSTFKTTRSSSACSGGMDSTYSSSAWTWKISRCFITPLKQYGLAARTAAEQAACIYFYPWTRRMGHCFSAP